MSPIGTLIDEEKARKRCLRFCKFTHSRRTSNMAAHLLAKHGLDLEEDRIWIEYYPDFLKHFIINDVSILT
ncbi:hypothetical protein CRYUN_Cryun20dG0072100 [Craigia yunnanensis]